MGLIKVAVGKAQEHYGTKYTIKPNLETANTQGWSHCFTFLAHETAVANTVPLCIGYTTDGWRYWVKWGTDAAGNGWTHSSTIHVFPVQVQGSQEYSVGHNENNWRARIVKGRDGGVGGQGWKHNFSFWAQPFLPPKQEATYIVSYLNNMYLGVNQNNELCMKQINQVKKPNRGSREGCQWLWDGKHLIHKVTQLAVVVHGGARDQGTKLSLYPRDNHPSQHWKRDGLHIISESNGLAMDIFNGDRSEGALVKTWPKNSGSNQFWRTEKL